MPFIIGEKVFSGPLAEPLLSRMLHEIESLPQPKIIPYHESKIDPAKTVMSLQREVLRNRHNPSGHKIRYFGTKLLRTCIEVCLYNGSEAETIHWDNSTYPHLTRDIQSFSGDKICVSLVGGKANKENSLQTLKSILTELYQAAQTTGKTIVITNQFLLERNTPQEQDKPNFIYFFLRYKISDLFQKIYRKPIPEEFFSTINLTSFTKDVSNKKVNMEMLVMYIFAVVFNTRKFPTEDEWKKFHKTWNTLAKHHHDGGYIDLEEAKAIKEFKVPTEAPKPFIDEQGFLRLMSYLFTKKGYDFTKAHLDKSSITYSDVRLENFVFDCEDHTFSIVDQRFPTSYEHARLAATHDPFQEATYHCHYDSGRFQQFILPQLTTRFRLAVLDCCELDIHADKMLSTPKLTTIKQKLKLGQDIHHSHLTHILETITWAANNRDFIRTYEPCSLFYYGFSSYKLVKLVPDSLLAPKSASTDIYLSHEFKEDTSSSEILKKLTQHSYTLKQKPDSTLDAILSLSDLKNSEEQFHTIAGILSANNISYEIVVFSDLGKCLCVKNINVKENALKIKEAGERVLVEHHVSVTPTKTMC